MTRVQALHHDTGELIQPKNILEDLKVINDELAQDNQALDPEWKLLFDPNEHGKAREKRVYTLDPLALD